MKKTPKYKINDKVFLLIPDLYNERKGEIIEIVKIFQETYPDGKFNMDGLATFEHTIHLCKLPYTFDGEILTVTYPQCDWGSFIEKEKIQVSKFYGYAYTVKTSKMNCVYEEESLILIK